MILQYEDDDTEYVEDKKPSFYNTPWIGVDLDGTLASTESMKGLDTIGKPVPLMMKRVKMWLDEGVKVKIFTARATQEKQIPLVHKWLLKNGLPELEVTNQKDYSMTECWDDRCVQVLENTGKPVLKASMLGSPKAPLLKEEIRKETFIPSES